MVVSSALCVPFLLLNYFPNLLHLSSGLLNGWIKGTSKAGAPVRETERCRWTREGGGEGEVLCVNQ